MFSYVGVEINTSRNLLYPKHELWSVAIFDYSETYSCIFSFCTFYNEYKFNMGGILQTLSQWSISFYCSTQMERIKSNVSTLTEDDSVNVRTHGFAKEVLDLILDYILPVPKPT